MSTIFFHDLDDIPLVRGKFFHRDGLFVVTAVLHQGSLEAIHQGKLVRRNANRTHLFKQRLLDGLTNPPHSIADELDILVHIKTLGSLEKTKVAFVNQIQKGKTAALVLARNADHKPQIASDKALQCGLANLFRLSSLDDLQQRRFLLRSQRRIPIQVPEV